jgi:hypothetical protein
MSFGVFGSIFLLAPFLQVTQGLSAAGGGHPHAPVDRDADAGRPVAGILSDRIGSRPLMATAWRCRPARWRGAGRGLDPDRRLRRARLPFIMAGAGMALVFAPSANAVLGSVEQRSAGQASGATKRDPRARRRDGHRRPGERVRRARLLRLAAGLHRRHGRAVWVGAAVLAAGGWSRC